MFECSGIVMIIISFIDVFIKSNQVFNHFLIGLILIITSMIIKSHQELVQIRRYIGDYRKYEDIEEDKVELKED